VPAFSRYVFAVINGQWELARNIVDLCGFVNFGGQVAVVPDSVMSQLLREADSDNVLPIGVVDEIKFLPGMRVRVMAGPLAGYVGQYVRAASSSWAMVLLNGRMSAKIQIDQLERVESRREAARRRNSAVAAA
jgi:transcription antitermination factor NusG